VAIWSEASRACLSLRSCRLEHMSAQACELPRGAAHRSMVRLAESNLGAEGCWFESNRGSHRTPPDVWKQVRRGSPFAPPGVLFTLLCLPLGSAAARARGTAGPYGHGMGTRAHLCDGAMSIQSASRRPATLPEGLADTAFSPLTRRHCCRVSPVATLRTRTEATARCAVMDEVEERRELDNPTDLRAWLGGVGRGVGVVHGWGSAPTLIWAGSTGCCRDPDVRGQGWTLRG
jgi:hypothetical protein